MRIAAVDIGTVTTRLMVADVSSEGISEVERSTDITHLGEGLTETGELSEVAMTRVVSVISRYATQIRELDVDNTVAVTTSATRDASNSQHFLSMLEEAGIRPEVISGERESRLSFLGASNGMEQDGLLMVDIGGGSTELVYGDSDPDEEVRVRSARSIDVGSRRITEMFIKSDPPTEAELSDARNYLVEQVSPYFTRLGERPKIMLAVAGTATSLAAIKMELAEYDPEQVHGYVLNGADLAELLGSLAGMTLEERKCVIGLHPGRASVIVIGTLILETVLSLAGLDSFRVSEHDILYGILLDAYSRYV